MKHKAKRLDFYITGIYRTITEFEFESIRKRLNHLITNKKKTHTPTPTSTHTIYHITHTNTLHHKRRVRSTFCVFFDCFRNWIFTRKITANQSIRMPSQTIFISTSIDKCYSRNSSSTNTKGTNNFSIWIKNLRVKKNHFNARFSFRMRIWLENWFWKHTSTSSL